ncbi:hypothetical protein [Actinomadura parmotrematis]|uniref:Ferritin-like domain-containing protein n=1 Tax=Actinomadura parmotrematis TaxID=2864039 RepID=A0ABS7FTD5_9ACTN|nr:hypothetical protein [Actinomadura parmotrematis]MBW8483664.1 hypothetical protein [Actinomadura parmotrematis]
MPDASAPVRRRPVLGAALLGAGALAVPLLGGCRRADATKASARAEVPVLVGAMAAEQDLIALYEAARGAHAALAGVLDPILAHHREHLDVLRRHYLPGSGDRAGEGGATPSPHTTTVPSSRSKALAALRAAESRAAAARVADVTEASAGLAQLLASIGACEAGHAAFLARPA